MPPEDDPRRPGFPVPGPASAPVPLPRGAGRLACPPPAAAPGEALPAAFGLVAAVAYHHYGTVYRIRGGTAAPPRTGVRALGGHQDGMPGATAAAARPPRAASACPPAAPAARTTPALPGASASLRLAAAPAVPDETGEPS